MVYYEKKKKNPTRHRHQDREEEEGGTGKQKQSQEVSWKSWCNSQSWETLVEMMDKLGIESREWGGLRLTGMGRRQSWKTILLMSKNKHQVLLQLTREESALTAPKIDRFIQYAFKERRTVRSRRRHGGRCFDAASLLANWLSPLRRMIDWGSLKEADMCVRRRSHLNISRQEELSVTCACSWSSEAELEEAGEAWEDRFNKWLHLQLSVSALRGQGKGMKASVGAAEWRSAQKLRALFH